MMSEQQATEAQPAPKSSGGGKSSGGRKQAPGMGYLFALAICLVGTAATLPIGIWGKPEAQDTFWIVLIIFIVMDASVFFTWIHDASKKYKRS